MAYRFELSGGNGRSWWWRLFRLARQRYVARARPPNVVSVLREDDALTRIRVGSHFDIPRLLAPFGPFGEGGAPQLQLGNGRGPTYCIGHAGRRNGVSVSSVFDPCRPDTSRAPATLHVATSLGVGNAPPSGAQRRSLFSA